MKENIAKFNQKKTFFTFALHVRALTTTRRVNLS
jgi:hypothetical protein